MSNSELKHLQSGNDQINLSVKQFPLCEFEKLSYFKQKVGRLVLTFSLI